MTPSPRRLINDEAPGSPRDPLNGARRRISDQIQDRPQQLNEGFFEPEFADVDEPENDENEEEENEEEDALQPENRQPENDQLLLAGFDLNMVPDLNQSRIENMRDCAAERARYPEAHTNYWRYECVECFST